jgi:hypothetical protein
MTDYIYFNIVFGYGQPHDNPNYPSCTPFCARARFGVARCGVARFGLLEDASIDNASTLLQQV